MTFKVGDVVKCIESISVSMCGPTEGGIYTITSANPDYIGFVLPGYGRGSIGRGESPNWGVSCFKLAYKPKLRRKT